MSQLIEPIAQLIGHLAQLPGVGRKSAQRLAFHILQMPPAQVRALADSLVNAIENTRQCTCCGNYSLGDECSICRDSDRDAATICVVRDARDIYAMERMRDYNGLYHVLGGSISPMDGVGPEDIRIPQLLERLEGISEVILATNPDIEGEATAAYIGRLLKGRVPRITRIAHGVPVGGDLEYADEATLSRAMEGRREI